MKIKVQGGTAKNGINLCLTCINGSVAQDEANHTYIRCSEFRTMVKRKILACTSYDDQNATSLFDMKQIAWVINAKAPGKIGFVKYLDLSRKEQEKIDAEVQDD